MLHILLYPPSTSSNHFSPSFTLHPTHYSPSNHSHSTLFSPVTFLTPCTPPSLPPSHLPPSPLLPFFLSRYYGVAIVNAAGKKLKLPKGSVTVTYQIHREGLSPPLAYTPLSEAWSDHLFYFSTLSFKRSGNYTVSFLVEGKDLSNVKPLVFPVTVTSKIKRCGAPDALDRLSAGKYIQSSGRFFSARKKDFDVFSEVFNGCLNPVYSELDAVNRCIATLYLALP